MTALRRILHQLDGNIAVELALVAPILLSVLAGISDYGRAALADMRLKAAVRAGLEYGQIQPNDTANIIAAVKAAASDTSLQVTTGYACQCANGTASQCDLTCADGLTPGGYLSITAQQSFAPIFPMMTSLIGDSVTSNGSIRAK